MFVEGQLQSVEGGMAFHSENWLIPCQRSTFNSHFKNNDMWVSLKSSVDPESALVGRRHGGTGFIAKKAGQCVIYTGGSRL